ncbi:MAG: type II secretion system minor pseudopilin GspJ [Pseudomonadota bacterium]
MRSPQKQSGFTLIEILVASALFVIVMAMGFVSLKQSIRGAERLEEASGEFASIQRAVQTMVRDLSQIQPRSVRDLIGSDRIPALMTGAEGGGIEMTTGGWTNPASLKRSVLQRIGYQVDENTLYRVQWPVLDRTQGTVPTRRPLLEGVLAMRMRFFDSQGNDTEDWPPLSGGGSGGGTGLALRPRAVEFTLELEDFGVISRLVEVAQ